MMGSSSDDGDMDPDTAAVLAGIDADIAAHRAGRAASEPKRRGRPPHPSRAFQRRHGQFGRAPCELDPREVEQVAKMGLSHANSAALLGCSRRTLLNRIADTPVIEVAWGRGHACALAHAAAKLRERIDAGDLKAIIFFLSRIGGWNANSKGKAAGAG